MSAISRITIDDLSSATHGSSLHVIADFPGREADPAPYGSLLDSQGDYRRYREALQSIESLLRPLVRLPHPYSSSYSSHTYLDSRGSPTRPKSFSIVSHRRLRPATALINFSYCRSLFERIEEVHAIVRQQQLTRSGSTPNSSAAVRAVRVRRQQRLLGRGRSSTTRRTPCRARSSRRA